MVDCLCVLEALHHLLLQLGVRDLCADGDTTLDGLLNLSDDWEQLCWRVDVLGNHAALCGVEGRDLEDSMSFLHVLNFDLGLKMDPGDSLRETDDSLKLAHCDGDASTLLGNLLVLGVHPI